MANDKSFKVKNGLQAGRYLQSAGTETAGSVGYDISGASYDSKSFSVASQDTSPYGITFKSDGTKMYVVGGAGDDINEYALSTAWDVSTASYSTVFSVASQATFPMDIHFKTDGTSFYVSDRNLEDIFQYDMTTAWDISTASYSSKSYAQAQSTNISGLTFNNTGSKMYISDITGSAVYQYTLSTAWDVSTASYDSVSLSISEGDTTPFTMTFNDDGTKLFTVDNLEFVFQYDLTSAYDLSTASYSGTSYTLTQDASQNYGIAFKSDGTKMYIVGATSDTVYQYSTVLYTQTLDLSTGTTFSFTPSGATTVSFTNPPASGIAIGFAVEINGDGSAITWPSSVKWHLGAAPTATASKELYTFITVDGGTTYYGKLAGSNIA